MKVGASVPQRALWSCGSGTGAEAGTGWPPAVIIEVNPPDAPRSLAHVHLQQLEPWLANAN